MWTEERNKIQIKLQEELRKILPVGSYSFLSFEESDNIQLSQDEWPEHKWNDHLYFQTDISNQDAIEKIILSYLSLNDGLTIHLFLLNYHSCLISMSNKTLLVYWRELLQLDGMDMFISIPLKNTFYLYRNY